MLSKIDIYNELGKGIVIFPFKENNIKENSINFTASNYAWSLSSGNIYYSKNKIHKRERFSIEKQGKKDIKFNIKEGGSALISVREDKHIKKYIIILPLSTTLIITEEILGLDSRIGATYHSKVGMVSQGLGHIGTIAGPNFTGLSIIAVNNSTKKPVAILVGETFISLVFYYLKTPNFSNQNPTVSAHTDKFYEWGIKATQTELDYLNDDNNKRFNKVREKMLELEEYKLFIERKKKEKNKCIKKIFNFLKQIIEILRLFKGV